MALLRRRDMWDLVVIGGGFAGLTAAWQAARRGLSTALLEAEIGCGGQIASVNVLTDWPAVGETHGVALVAALVEQVRSLGVEIIHQPAHGLQANGGPLLIETQGRKLRARRAVVATGARLRTLGVPGEEVLRGKGVSQCADCDAHFFRDQDVVVVGGGDAALQEALVLAGLCRSVAIVARSALRAKRAYIDRATKFANIQFVWDSVVETIVGNGTVSGVRLRHVKNGEVADIACSGVFPFIGTEPNSGFLPPAVTRDDLGRVVTDDQFRTAVSSVFAIGAVRIGYAGELISAAGEAVGAVAAIARDLSV